MFCEGFSGAQLISQVRLHFTVCLDVEQTLKHQRAERLLELGSFKRKEHAGFLMYRESPKLFLFDKHFLVHTTNMATLVGLRHPVTIAITHFTSPDKLTNDFLILNFIFNFKGTINE